MFYLYFITDYTKSELPVLLPETPIANRRYEFPRSAPSLRCGTGDKFSVRRNLIELPEGYSRFTPEIRGGGARCCGS